MGLEQRAISALLIRHTEAWKLWRIISQQWAGATEAKYAGLTFVLSVQEEV